MTVLETLEARTDAVAEGTDRRDPEPPGRRGRRIPILAYAAVLAVLAAGLTMLVLALQGRATGAATVNGDDPVAAARTQAINLMTLDYRTAQRDLQRLVDGSTGTMKQQYADALSGQIASVSAAKSVSTGTILSAGLSYPKGRSSLATDKAEVLVAGDATVRFPKSGSTPASSMTAHYRFRFEMQKVDGVWKSAALNFAGLPSITRMAS